VKLIADECVPKPIVVALRTRFKDVVSVEEHAPGTELSDILAWANREQRILVTEDYDFGELVNLGQLPAYGIVIIAPGVFRGDVDGVADLIAGRIAELSETLKGNLTILEKLRIRQRNLRD